MQYRKVSPRRPRVRDLAVFITLLISSAYIAPSTGSAELPDDGIYFPLDSDWNSIYSRIENLIGEENWVDAIDGLVDLFKQKELKRQAEPLRSWAAVVPSGGGFALGTGSAMNRLLQRLPPEARKRFIKAIDPSLIKIWNDTENQHSDEYRAQFRNLLLREYPWSTLADEVAREELDKNLELGDFERALNICKFITGTDRIENGSGRLRIRATWLLLKISRQLGNREIWSEAVDQLSNILKSNILESNSEKIPESLRKNIEASLREPFLTPEESSGSTSPSPAYSDDVLSPLVLNSQRGKFKTPPTAEEYENQPQAINERFELGNVQARRPFELSELGNHLASQIPPAVATTCA